MHLYVNTTSPFVRLVRLAIEEKGLSDRVELEIVDPWKDPDAFLEANPAGRVPVLTTDDGHVIAEAHLILRYLDEIAAPSIYPAEDLARTLAIAAPALGATEAATAIIIGRKSSDGFDTDMVGSKRYRTMAEGLARLDAHLPRDFDDRPDIANFAAVTALDYIVFRFTDRDWLADLPNLRAWRERQKGRPSLEATMPYI
ncbi:glutathione S-transferase family protein [Roseivivax isoporae]|uniref:Glutathione S-transferase n=1 Tax=Roseivivax isoporae LMG 25204 TaxID=1449351 RepID=X7FD31_9RHOB|nr:glutathione S-transferase family protein [Roseivivax isoporae]ETX30817.1 glutathione S-transferase [Roseivivax isoporae LMG 25204]